jgi:hypothetical protein
MSWLKTKMVCPKCGISYSNIPKIERTLMIMQDSYFDSGKNIKYLNELAKYLIIYAKSLIKKYYSSYITCEEDINYFAENAASFVIEEYYKYFTPNVYTDGNDFRMYASFGGYLVSKIKQVIFNKQERLQEDISLNWEFDDEHSDGNSYHEDKQSQNSYDQIDDYENRLYLLNHVTQFIFKISAYCPTKGDDLVRLLAFDLNLRLGEKFADKLFQEERKKNGKIAQYSTYGRKRKQWFLKTLEAVRLELLNLQEANK